MKYFFLTIFIITSFFFNHTFRADSSDEMEYYQSILEIMESYYRIIESTHSISSDSEKAAILQIHRIQKYYKEMDDYKNAIDFLQEMLEKTKNPAIRNAVYLMLGDNLEETGRPQEAINLLKQGLDENLKNSD